MNEKLRLHAYYYNFDSTGNYDVDKILSEVACAGKSYHNTDCWNDEYNDGTTPVSRIQSAANELAKKLKAKEEKCKYLLKEYSTGLGRYNEHTATLCKIWCKNKEVCYSDMDISNWTHCPYCGKEIEVVNGQM